MFLYMDKLAHTHRVEVIGDLFSILKILSMGHFSLREVESMQCYILINCDFQRIGSSIFG